MKAVEIQVRDEVYTKLENLASQQKQAVNDFAREKLEEIVRAWENFSELEYRASRGSFEKFRAAMSSVPKVPPVPGDELPSS